jgi:hypothetical protein
MQQHLDEAAALLRRACHAAPEKVKDMASQVQQLAAQHQIDGRTIIYAAFSVVAALWTIISIVQRFVRSKRASAPPRTPDLEKRGPFSEAGTKSKYAMAEPGGM